MINSVGSFAPQVTTITQPGSAQAERGKEDLETRTREGEVAREAGEVKRGVKADETQEAEPSRDLAPRAELKAANAEPDNQDPDPYAPRGSVVDVTV